MSLPAPAPINTYDPRAWGVVIDPTWDNNTTKADMNTQLINQAIADISAAGGGTLEFVGGTVSVTPPLIGLDGVRILGSSPHMGRSGWTPGTNTVIGTFSTAPAGTPMLQIGTTNELVGCFVMEKVGLNGAGCDFGISMNGGVDCSFRDLRVANANVAALYIPCQAERFYAYRSYFSAQKYGLWHDAQPPAQGSGGMAYLSESGFDYCEFQGVNDVGIFFGGQLVGDVALNQPRFQTSANGCLRAGYVKGLKIDTPWNESQFPGSYTFNGGRADVVFVGGTVGNDGFQSALDAYATGGKILVNNVVNNSTGYNDPNGNVIVVGSDFGTKLS